MARYIKRFTRLGSAGPTEERGFAIWAGYDLVGIDRDLSAYGLLKADEHEEEARAVTTFVRVEPDDAATHAKLGLSVDWGLTPPHT